MEKIIAGRHLDINDSTKEFIIQELSKIENDYHKLTSARVVIEEQKNWHYTEILLHGKNLSIEAKAKAKPIRTSISGAIEKTKKQLKKHLDKVQNHHPSH